MLLEPIDVLNRVRDPRLTKNNYCKEGCETLLPQFFKAQRALRKIAQSEPEPSRISEWVESTRGINSQWDRSILQPFRSPTVHLTSNRISMVPTPNRPPSYFLFDSRTLPTTSNTHQSNTQSSDNQTTSETKTDKSDDSSSDSEYSHEKFIANCKKFRIRDDTTITKHSVEKTAGFFPTGPTHIEDEPTHDDSPTQYSPFVEGLYS